MHLDAIFADAAGQLGAARDRGELTLMIGHINVAGAVASVGQPQIGQELELDQALLTRLGPIYCGLSHIHKAQQVGSAYYAGSMSRLDWGEVEEKRYLVVECQRDGAAWEWRVGSRPINVPAMWHVEGELHDDNTFGWLVKAGPDGTEVAPPRVWTGAEVRVRYRFPAAKRALVDEAVIRETFAGASRLVLEPIAVADQALRSPAVAAARTLTEKLEAWAPIACVEFTDDLRELLAALETAEPTVLLTALEQELSDSSLNEATESSEAVTDADVVKSSEDAPSLLEVAS